MEQIREWVITIISIVIFITFVEFLLPNSNHKRYINVIIGLLIMLVILNPLMELVKGGENIADGVLMASNQLEQMTLNNRMKTLEVNNQEIIIELYKENLKEQMASRLESQLGVQVAEIDLEIEEKKEDQFGMIKAVSIILTEEAPPPEETIKIKEVSINVRLPGKKDNNSEDESIMLVNGGETIINDFNQFYNIPRESISVFVQKNK